MSRFILPLQSVFNLNGLPFDGAKLEFDIVGTSTPKDTFSDEALTTPNTNPVIANASGRFGDIYLNGDYDVTLTDKNDVLIWGPEKVSEFAIAFEKSFLVANMMADTSLSIGDIVRTTGYTTNGDGGDNTYEIVAASTGTDDGGSFIDLGTFQAKGLFPGGIIHVNQFGADSSGVLDSITALTNADAYANTNNLPLVMTGSYRTTSTFTITAQSLVTNRAAIDKDLDDSPVVIFSGSSGFKQQEGFFTVRQNAEPTALQTEAHGIVFENVIRSNFSSLNVGYSAYCYVNDSSTGTGLSWGNHFGLIAGRGGVQGFMNWEFPGTGANTNNFFGAMYFSGKDPFTGLVQPKQSAPFILDNCVGFVVGAFNFEFIEVDGGGDFCVIRNASTLTIGALHTEGLEQSAAGDHGIFHIVNTNTIANITIENMQLSNINQSAGRLSLIRADTNAIGKCEVTCFSGLPSSNTFTDFRKLDSDGSFLVKFGVGSNANLYFTGSTLGTVPSDFPIRLMEGNLQTDGTNILTNPSVTPDIGKATFIRFSGTPAGSITDIAATQIETERQRIITIENTTGGNVVFTGGGNLNAPSDQSFNLTLSNGRIMLISYNFNTDEVEILSLT